MFLESFYWHSGNYEFVDEENNPDFKVILDQKNGEPLHGNMETLEKKDSSQHMKTNHIGADCLTRPDLCDKGLAVNFQVKGTVPCLIVFCH